MPVPPPKTSFPFADSGLAGLLGQILSQPRMTRRVTATLGWRQGTPSIGGVHGWQFQVRGIAGRFGLVRKTELPTSLWETTIYSLTYTAMGQAKRPVTIGAGTVLKSLRPRGHDAPGGNRITFSEKPDRPLHWPKLAVLVMAVDPFSDAMLVGISSAVRSMELAPHQHAGDNVSHAAPAPGTLPGVLPGFSFFQVLAASLTYLLGAPPVFLLHQEHPGPPPSNHRLGPIQEVDFFLGYGEGDFLLLLSEIRMNWEEPVYFRCWKAPAEPPAEFKEMLWWSAHSLPGTARN